MTLSVQFVTMIAMVLAGLYLGMGLDTFRRFALHWKNSIILTYMLEISFWLMQTFILFFILFRVNGGELRFYVFAAVLLGFSIYQVFVKKLYKRILEKMIQMIAAVCRFFQRLVKALLIAPIKWIFMLLVKIILGIGSALAVILLFILRVILLPFKYILKLIYRLLPQSVKNILYKLAGFYSKIKNICIQWMKRR